MTKGIKRKLLRVQAAVQAEISGNAESGNKYARGLASEGYAGGYWQAIADVLLALNGVEPSTRYWRERA